MTSELVPFDASHLSAVSDFSKRLWGRPDTSDFFRWRYLECPKQTGLLALRDGRCVATVWAVQRGYRIGERCATLLEPFDWYVLPELLHSGIGVRLMRRLMRRSEPLVNVGGTDYTRHFLPRLGWREIGSLRSFVLPRTSASLTPILERSAGVPRVAAPALAALVSRLWCRPQRCSPGFDGSLGTVHRLGDETMRLYDGSLAYAAVPVPSQAWHAWLRRGAPGAGRFMTLEYRNADNIVGWALGRVYDTPQGLEASIVDIFTPRAEPEVYRWMVSTLVERLLPFGPTQIRARASCPALARALRQNRFLPGPKTPVFLWSKDPFALPQPLHLTADTADSAIMPYELPPANDERRVAKDVT